jgi:large subunit ribosomal protein L16
MLQPARTKYRKAHKGRIHGNASRCNKLNYGAYGLKALQPERIISNQIEAARVALTRYMKRTGKVWTRVFPNIPVSKKPVEVRMGKGKGSTEFWVCRVKPGRILFEVDGVNEITAKEALYKASAKLPIKTKFIKR